jgi:hypothetical protein
MPICGGLGLIIGIIVFFSWRNDSSRIKRFTAIIAGILVAISILFYIYLLTSFEFQNWKDLSIPKLITPTIKSQLINTIPSTNKIQPTKTLKIDLIQTSDNEIKLPTQSFLAQIYPDVECVSVENIDDKYAGKIICIYGRIDRITSTTENHKKNIYID